MHEHEQAAWARGHRRIAGVDEAGRGPLAGPVVAAAAILDPSLWPGDGPLAEVNDSKKLSPHRREVLFDQLQHEDGVAFAIGISTVGEIDRLNILRATHRAMARAVEALAQPPDFLLVDGRPVPGLPVPSEALVQGDGRSRSIAAASILAKVTRDAMMLELDRKYPAYGFSAHKGYGTRAHRDALQRYGPCPAHRRSFAPVRQLVLSL